MLAKDINNRWSAGKDAVVIYNRYYDTRTCTDESWTEFTVTNGVVGKICKGNSKIPNDGYVISVRGKNLSDLNKLVIGSRVAFEQKLDGLDDCPDVVGAGPRLVANGAPDITAVIEKFQPDIALENPPRTALGYTADRHILLVVVDGRQTGYSNGMYLDELASYMLRLGAVDAMNFDGGGSSAMYLNGKLVNIPSDKDSSGRSAERAVGDILAVVLK